jgi:cell division protein ZapA
MTTHSIRVLGRDLQVKSAAAAGHVAEVEALVNEKVAEANASTNGGDTQMVAILAMMNLAEAYLAAKNELEEGRRVSTERLTSLLERLDEHDF